MKVFSLSSHLQGFEYVTDPAKCCGSCVQTSCIYTTPDNVTHIIGVSDGDNIHFFLAVDMEH